MYKKVLSILICSFLFACSGPEEVKIPDNVLPEEKMAEVMVDVHLLEASMNMSVNLANPAKIGVVGGNVALNTDIFKKNHITKKKYDDSFAFYTNNPKLLSEVYQLVLNDLSKMQAQVMNEK